MSMILVTGATGNLGKKLVEKLNRKKIRVLVRDKTKYTGPGEVFEGDITNDESLKGIAKNVNIVIHLAGLVDYSASREKLFEVNTLGTKNILKRCRNVDKFIYISSTSVYGKKLPKIPADEKTPINPSGDYGMSKAMAEKDVIGSGLDYIILRPSDIYGPGFTKGYFEVLKMIEGGKMKILGDGKNRIPFIHVDDVVDAILLSLEKGSGIYNVSAKNPKTQEEILKITANMLDVPTPNIHIPMLMAKILLKITTKGDPKELNEYIEKIAMDRMFDISKIEKDLDFVQKIEIDKGIKEMVQYYKEMIKHD